MINDYVFGVTVSIGFENVCLIFGLPLQIILNPGKTLTISTRDEADLLFC